MTKFNSYVNVGSDGGGMEAKFIKCFMALNKRWSVEVMKNSREVEWFSIFDFFNNLG
jgi:hypothetical protein